MSHAIRFSFTLCILLWIVPSTVRAQQPFCTDDADVNGTGKFHFQFANNTRDGLQPGISADF